MDGIIGFMIMMYPVIVLVLFLGLGPDHDGKHIFGASLLIWALLWLMCLGGWLMEKGI